MGRSSGVNYAFLPPALDRGELTSRLGSFTPKKETYWRTNRRIFGFRLRGRFEEVEKKSFSPIGI